MPKHEPVNVLMVDDQPAKLLSYEAILSDLGENLIQASSANEALEQLLKHEIAVVLMDVSMPEIDGFELTAMIRQHPRYQKTAIIFVSAVHMSDLDRLKGYEVGAVDYIPVPVIPNILRAKVSVFAELFRKTRELQELNHELERRVEERTAELKAYAARLLEGEERFRVILQNTTTVIYLLDAEERFVQINRRFEELFACTNDTVHGRRVEEVLPPEVAADCARSHREVLQRRESIEYEEIVPTSNGTRIYTAVKTPLFDESGKPRGIVSVATDITERKHAEDERAELLVREREARRLAEEAIDARDEFLSVAAHELKTPVTGLRATAQIITRRLQKGDMDGSPWLSDRLRVIDQQTERLTRLIGQLLDVSRIDQAKHSEVREPIDLGELTERLVSVFRTRTSMHTFTLDVASDAVAEVDPVGMEQVVSNLLDNAIKYSPDGGQIDVAVGHKDAAHATLSVRDHGIGIAPERREQIFERFFQAHTKDHRSGLGLGLYITQQIVALHGGTITAEFPSDGGTRFSITLPIHAQAAVPVPEVSVINAQ